ncbi:MAG: hypothetical protein ACFFCS_26335 [Candidatus Hodarchaeota archaeon]
MYVLSEPVTYLGFQIFYMFILFNISFACFLFPFEKNFKKSRKHLISYLLILGAAASFIAIVSGTITLDIGETGNDTLIMLAGIIHPIIAFTIIISFVIAIIGSLAIYFRFSVHTSGALKKKSLSTAIGFINWLVSVIVGNVFRGELQSISPILMLTGPAVFYTGTFLLAYGFKGIMSAVIDFYQSKHICIVHKGVIEGKVFVCSGCNIFYCMKCKDAIADAENKCWNCGSMLDKSILIDIRINAEDPCFNDFKEFKKKFGTESDVDTLKTMMRILKTNRTDDGELQVLQADAGEPPPDPALVGKKR